MTTFAAQRLNMVESQVRPSDVTDRRILRAFAEVERERFVPPEMAALAYMDEAVPLLAGHQQAPQRLLMPPRTFAKLAQLAAIEASDAVLIVGAGRGYSAAVLSRIARSVTALEADETLASAAKAQLADLENVVVATGPLPAGPAGDQPFDVIVVEGTLFERPDALLARLKADGRLVGILVQGGIGHATRWTRTPTTFAESQAFEASAAVLPGFERRPTFVL